MKADMNTIVPLFLDDVDEQHQNPTLDQATLETPNQVTLKSDQHLSI